MKQSKRYAAKKTAVLLSAMFCIWAVWLKVQQISPQDTASALGYAAGISVKDKEGVPGLEGMQQGDKPEQDVLPYMEDDGIAPFHQYELPIISSTPDPDRDYNTVEEITLNDGSQLAGFKVKDSTDSGTDLAAELLNDPSVKLKADGSVEVLIYHTHTTEAYLDNYFGYYYTDMATRSQNPDMTVVAVGEALKAELEKAGIGVVHDTTVNDTMYNGSYSRSWDRINENCRENPGIQVTIDLHRDSMTTDAGVKYKPTAEVEGRKAAQIMVMAGCDANGGWGDFPNWLENLRFALRVQQKAAEMYPGLMRPMSFSNSKYNMNATTGSILIEVGTEVNTISEAKYSGQLFGSALAGLLTTELAGE